MAAKKKRRKFTPELDKEICAYKATHGSGATLKKYKIAPSVLSRICRSVGKPPKPRPKKTTTAARANGVELVLLLRRARSLIEKEVRAGGDLRASDSYVLMATTIAEGQ